MYNYNHLYYFYITVNSNSVTEAAEHLKISQPSLSSQLKVLEDFLQIKLFHKVGRKNELTSEGLVIFGFCKRIFEISEEMNELITENIPFASRNINIGVSNEISNSFVVAMVSHFLNKYSDQLKPKINMVSNDFYKLEQQLLFKEIDIVVSSSVMVHPNLVCVYKAEVPVNLICAFDKKISIKNKHLKINKTLNLLLENNISEWVVPANNFKLRGEINSFFELNSIKGRMTFESDVMESLIRSVIDGIGMTFLPLIYVPKELEQNALSCLGPKNGYWKHHLWLTSHTSNKEDQLLNSLAKSFKEVCLPVANKHS